MSEAIGRPRGSGGYVPQSVEDGEYEKAPHSAVLFSAPLGARTLDTLIKSQVLYQLS